MAAYKYTLRFALAGAGAGAFALSRKAFASSSTVQLASTVVQPALPTTVLVHGLDSCKETWADVAADLAKGGYPAVAVDLRGHGESPIGDPQSFSPHTLAMDVLAATEALGISGRVVLVGHSMGGRVAMRIAAMDAERVQQVLPFLILSPSYV